MNGTNKLEPLVIAAIPHCIEPDWGPHADVLAGFPVNLAYAAIRDADGSPAVVVCTYSFDPGTYAEDADHREMWYHPRHPSPYRVCVAYDKRDARWQTTKYRGDAVVAVAEGASFEVAMMQAMMAGLIADEAVDDSEAEGR